VERWLSTAPFFAAEAERLGVTVAALKEEHVAHDGDRFVKTGQGACSSFFGINLRQTLGGRYEYELATTRVGCNLHAF
jgi:hypothetical protein